MLDEQIIELFWQRDQTAIEQLDEKYGTYCHSISYRILYDHLDVEECVNDSYLSAWNSMPPHRPKVLPAFVGRIVRNISLDYLKRRNRKKRGNGELDLVLEELADVIPSNNSTEEEIDKKILAEKLTEYLQGMKSLERDEFLRRYWYGDSMEEICHRYSFSMSKAKSMLFRSRRKLKKYLEKEGIL
ncbi:MAG: RNA polymerase sigma factor [Clostridiales bacterium]|nr:RNA polymerase sigma factor [Clostridiales bacterium]